MYLMTMSSGTLFSFFPQTVSCDDGADEDIVAENTNLSAIFQLLKQSDQGQTDLNAFLQLMGIAGTEPGMIVAIRDFQLALANGGQELQHAPARLKHFEMRCLVMILRTTTNEVRHGAFSPKSVPFAGVYNKLHI
jgi:hypothetical protein